jgi:hypothetical protein
MISKYQVHYRGAGVLEFSNFRMCFYGVGAPSHISEWFLASDNFMLSSVFVFSVLGYVVLSLPVSGVGLFGSLLVGRAVASRLLRMRPHRRLLWLHRRQYRLHRPLRPRPFRRQWTSQSTIMQISWWFFAVWTRLAWPFECCGHPGTGSAVLKQHACQSLVLSIPQI